MAVLPFINLRDPAHPEGLPAYLQAAVAQTLLRAGQASVLDAPATAQWQAHLRLDALGDVTPAQLRRMGVDAVVQGGVQQVLNQVALRLRVQSAQGDRLSAAQGQLEFSLASQPPRQVLERMGNLLAEALPGAVATVATPQPEDWGALVVVYRLLPQEPPAGDPQARPTLLRRLAPYQALPGLAAAVQRRRAELLLEQALLFERDPQRQQTLQAAQQALQAALAAEPWNADPRALLGEVWFYLRQDYLARTEASVARLKNPLNSLAYVVLGLVAGPSSGDGITQLRVAQRLNPFLWPAQHVPGTPPFQGGVLDAPLSRWAQDLAELQANRARGGGPLSAAMERGIQAFQRRDWPQAQESFAQAQEEDSEDYLPALYQQRIQLETGHPQEAAETLRLLAAENPLQLDVALYLGVALERTGQHAEARQALAPVLQEQPRNALALQFLAAGYLAQEQWQEALDLLRPLVEVRPGDVGAWLHLAMALAHMGQWQEAGDAVAKALALEPGSRQAQEWQSLVRQRRTE